MNNTKSYFASVTDSLTKVVAAQSRLDNNKLARFERGEEIIIGRIVNKQVPHLLKKLIDTIALKSELEGKLNGVNASDYASVINELMKEHPHLWHQAFETCKKITIVTMVVRSLEQASAEITRVVAKVL